MKAKQKKKVANMKCNEDLYCHSIKHPNLKMRSENEINCFNQGTK